MGLRKAALSGRCGRWRPASSRRRRRRRRRTSSSSRAWSIAPAPMRPNGIPFADGVADYITLINARDGGINGVKITFEECETGYATDRGVECYERLKGKGPTGAAYFSPLSTGITFALTEKAPGDKIPLHHHGLRPLRQPRRRGVQLELPAARHLLDGGQHRHPAHRQGDGRLRQAQGQEDRAALSRLALRQGADRGARGHVRKKYGFEFLPIPVPAPGSRAEVAVAADPPAAARTMSCCGAGAS